MVHQLKALDAFWTVEQSYLKVEVQDKLPRLYYAMSVTVQPPR